MSEVPKIRPVSTTQGQVSPEFIKEIERFQASSTKIAVQKDGELTDVSRTVFLDEFGVHVPNPNRSDRLLVATSQDGEYGFLFARNKDIGAVVASGAVDMAVIGTDRMTEDELEDKVDIVASYKALGLWSLVLATSSDKNYASIDQISTIATKYPKTTAAYLGSIGLGDDVEVLPIAGGAEIYPYLGYNGTSVDAIVDLTVSGASLAAHNLSAWEPPISEIYPVLIKTPIKEQSS